MDLGLAIGLIIAAAVVFGVAGFVVGGAHRKKVAEAAIGSATEEAARIVNNAMTEAEQKKKYCYDNRKYHIIPPSDDTLRPIQFLCILHLIFFSVCFSDYSYVHLLYCPHSNIYHSILIRKDLPW